MTENGDLEPGLRQAVRGLLVDPADRILLMQVSFIEMSGWLLPGGGIEPGEDHRGALRRELTEEVGLPEIFIGPQLCIETFYSGRVTGQTGQTGQTNHIYLVPCHGFEVRPTMSAQELQAEGIVGHRWWTVAEIAANAEEIYPTGLADMAAQVLEFGAPATPIIITDGRA